MEARERSSQRSRPSTRARWMLAFPSQQAPGRSRSGSGQQSRGRSNAWQHCAGAAAPQTPCIIATIGSPLGDDSTVAHYYNSSAGQAFKNQVLANDDMTKKEVLSREELP